uniref:Ribosomal RNA small subunit methyltransferase A n=1 Tax=Lygus hesperus TaxID=30085 RepID=A0A0A9W2N1_LYGHE
MHIQRGALNSSVCGIDPLPKATAPDPCKARGAVVPPSNGFLLLPRTYRNVTLASLYPHSNLTQKQLPQILDLFHLPSAQPASSLAPHTYVKIPSTYEAWRDELVAQYNITVVHSTNELPAALRSYISKSIDVDSSDAVPHLLVQSASLHR